MTLVHKRFSVSEVLQTEVRLSVSLSPPNQQKFQHLYCLLESDLPVRNNTVAEQDSFKVLKIASTFISALK